MKMSLKKTASMVLAVLMLSAMLMVPSTAADTGDTLISGHHYAFATAASPFYKISMPGNNSQDGTMPELYSDNWSDSETFTVTNRWGDWYTIAHASSGKVLTVESATETRGEVTSNKVSLWTYNGKSNQLWKFIPQEGGGYRIQNKLGKYLALSYSGKFSDITHGTGVWVFSEGNTKTQIWYLNDAAANAARVTTLGIPTSSTLTLKPGSSQEVEISFRGADIQKVDRTWGYRVNSNKATTAGMRADIVKEKSSLTLTNYGIWNGVLTLRLRLNRDTSGRKYWVDINITDSEKTSSVYRFYVNVA